MMIDTTRYLRPRLHPNGFIQLDLNDIKRLHVWPDEPLQAQKTRHTIHNHVFDMASLVICGELTNLVYSDVYSESGAYILHQAESVNAVDTVLKPTDSRVNLYADHVQTMRAGESYYLEAYRLHDSKPRGLTATIMTKVKKYGGRPVIAVPADVAPDNDFRRETVDEKTLWRIIIKVLEKAKEHVRR
jgi:hypothetical protein